MQTVAIKYGYHQWEIKPLSCWLFPLTLDNKGEIKEPVDKTNDNNTSENYPGFASYTDCLKEDEDGVKWQEKFSEEINYYKTIFK